MTGPVGDREVLAGDAGEGVPFPDLMLPLMAPWLPLWQPSDDHLLEDAERDAHRAARLAVAMPGCYLIEAITDPGSGPARICGDGQRLWRAYPDRVAVRAAGPHCTSGPPGRCRGSWPAGGPVVADQVDSLIDRALGICLRLDDFCQGHRVLRAELTGLSTEVDPAVFGFESPPGVPVITGGLLALQAAKGAAALAFQADRRWLHRHDTADPGTENRQSSAACRNGS